MSFLRNELVPVIDECSGRLRIVKLISLSVFFVHEDIVIFVKNRDVRTLPNSLKVISLFFENENIFIFIVTMGIWENWMIE